LNPGGAPLGGAAAVKAGPAGAAEAPGVAAFVAFPQDGQNFDSDGNDVPQLGQNMFVAPQGIQTETHSDR